MKTIEQYEVQISQQVSLIKSGLLLLEENVHVIPDVVGRDPQYVYELLSRKFENTYNEYMTSTIRNVRVMETYVVRFDKILSVLEEAKQVIAPAPIQVGITTEIDETIDKAAVDLEAFLDDVADVKIGRDYSKMAIVGAGSFAVMKVLGFSTTTSLIGAGVISYVVVSPEVEQTA